MQSAKRRWIEEPKQDETELWTIRVRVNQDMRRGRSEFLNAGLPNVPRPTTEGVVVLLAGLKQVVLGQYGTFVSPG